MAATVAELKQQVLDAVADLAAFKDTVSTAITGVTGDVQGLKSQIEALLAGGGGATQAELEDIALSIGALQTAVADLDPLKQQIVAVDDSTPPTPGPGEPA